MTADELMEMPGDGFHRYELVRGELIEMSPSGAEHASIAARIIRHLAPYVDAQKLGETYAAEGGFIISRDPDTIFAPDVGFVRADRVVKTKKFFPGPPDLAVEVISPNDSYSEVNAKV
ncbi:MAG TPA: Uma2 family endonuclease, partial [Thermoanaerobaculia bacterium]|nr:Uma2 family endonuclease [Thermoanaerobaculia bacterium]